MRFKPGLSYLFMHIDFTPTSLRIGSSYFPWEDKLNEIKIVELTCESHHKVTDGYSQETESDGFIFKDNQGRVWHNQYPVASYGQMSTDCDYYARPAWDIGQEEFDSMKFYRLELMSVQLERILRGISHFETQGNNKQHADSLREFYDSLVQKLLSDHNTVVEQENRYPDHPELVNLSKRVVLTKN